MKSLSAYQRRQVRGVLYFGCITPLLFSMVATAIIVTALLAPFRRLRRAWQHYRLSNVKRSLRTPHT